MILDIISYFSDSPYFNVLTAVIALASAIAALLPVPKEGSTMSKIDKVIDFLALNVGKAKDKPKEEKKEEVVEAKAVLKSAKEVADVAKSK